MTTEFFPALKVTPVGVATDPPENGDLRVRELTQAVPHVWLVEWYGEMVSRAGKHPFAWRSTSWGANFDGVFPTLEDAKEAILGPRVVAYYRQTDPTPLTRVWHDDKDES